MLNSIASPQCPCSLDLSRYVHSEKLIGLFKKRGGQISRCLQSIMAPMVEVSILPGGGGGGGVFFCKKKKRGLGKKKLGQKGVKKASAVHFKKHPKNLFFRSWCVDFLLRCGFSNVFFFIFFSASKIHFSLPY